MQKGYYVMLQKWNYEVAKCDENPRKLVAAAFIGIHDDKTAEEILGPAELEGIVITVMYLYDCASFRLFLFCLYMFGTVFNNNFSYIVAARRRANAFLELLSRNNFLQLWQPSQLNMNKNNRC